MTSMVCRRWLQRGVMYRNLARFLTLLYLPTNTNHLPGVPSSCKEPPLRTVFIVPIQSILCAQVRSCGNIICVDWDNECCICGLK